MQLTYKMLADKGACSDQVTIYKKNFPDDVKITLPICKKAAKIGLNLDWFAQHFLSAPAWKVYEEATAPAWKVYEEATAPAWKVYEEATAPAWKAYQEATAQAWKAYQEARAPALFKAIKMMDK